MPRSPLITPVRPLTIHIPGELFVRLELYLTSLALGKVPQGAYQAFFVERINEFFDKLEHNTAMEAEILRTEG